MEEEPVLVISHLTTSLSIGKGIYKAVEDVTFNLNRGKTLALVGESGCGKTLTALSIMRILPHPPALPSIGEVIYEGENLLELSEKKMRRIRGKNIAMIFQDPMSALNPVYTIGNQLIEVAELHLGLYGDEAIARAEKSLLEVGIQSPMDRLGDYPYQLSGGMKQRVMIAMALMCEPDILIADEPTTSLDVTIQAQVLTLMKELQQRKGTTLLLITHDLGVVAEMADEVIVMYAAETVEKGDVYQIFDHHAHPYTMGLFNSRLTLDTKRGMLTPIKGGVPSMTHFPKGCRFHPRCPYVMDRCRHGSVPEFIIEGGQKVKCWLYDKTVESEEKLYQIKNTNKS